jgi:hypothetical protein
MQPCYALLFLGKVDAKEVTQLERGGIFLLACRPGCLKRRFAASILRDSDRW